MSRPCRSVSAPAVLAVVAAAIAVTGCGNEAPPVGLTDAEKKNRIEAMYRDYAQDFPQVAEISAAALLNERKMGEEGPLIVDVREPEERAVSRIPGSIAKDAFEAERHAYRDRQVVVHCTIGYRSGVYAAQLAERGIEAKNLRGSILSWIHEGGALVTPGGEPTQRVHVYGPRWNLTPDGYEPVW